MKGFTTMSFLKKMFGKKEKQRTLSSAKELNTGDIIVLTDSFALPESLRTQQFQVTSVNSYEYENSTQTEWTLTGNNELEIFLSLDIDDKTYLKFALKIEHQDIETLFDLDEFSTLFDEPGDAFLNRQHDNNKTMSWTSEQYQQNIYAKVGYFHRKDNRSQALSPYEGQGSGEQFELYQLLDKDQSRGIDVEVWQDGDTDIFLSIYRPLTDIIDMYPGS
jgi:hypothetical protein